MANKYLDIMQAAALECGKLVLDRTAMNVHTTNKSSSRDVVTQYDVAIQTTLKKRLLEAFPDASFVAEEDPEQIMAHRKLIFVIDPIDGTMNFVKNLHHSCISIACLLDGFPAAAVVYDPYKKELFRAARGEGAYLNDVPISVTEDDLADTLVLFGTSPYYADKTDQTFRTISRLYAKCLDVRRMGAAALDLCYIACGRAGLFFEAQLSLWDYAAGGLIVNEAGGIVNQLDGSALDYMKLKSSVLAGTQRTIKQSGLLEEVSI